MLDGLYRPSATVLLLAVGQSRSDHKDNKPAILKALPIIVASSFLAVTMSGLCLNHLVNELEAYSMRASELWKSAISLHDAVVA